MCWQVPQLVYNMLRGWLCMTKFIPVSRDKILVFPTKKRHCWLYVRSIHYRLRGILFTTEILLLQTRNAVSPGLFFPHVIASSRQSRPKQMSMFTRMCKACKESHSPLKLKKNIFEWRNMAVIASKKVIGGIMRWLSVY